MFPLLRYFSLMSGLVIGLATVLITAGFYQHEFDQLVENGENQNFSVAGLLANAAKAEIEAAVNLPPGTKIDHDSLAGRDALKPLHKAFSAIVKGQPILKVKLYNLDGLTVYSSESSQIGEDYSADKSFIAAATYGIPTSELVHRETSYGGLLTGRDVVETYLPVYFDDKTIGAVFELYFDATAHNNKVKNDITLAIILLLTAFATVYGGMFFIVRRADIALRQQYDLIQQNEKAAQRQNVVLEQEVGRRHKAQKSLQEAHDTMETQVLERTRELRLLSMAVEQSPASVVVSDVQGIIEYVNPHFISTTGYGPTEIIGAHTNILRSQDIAQKDYRKMLITLKSGKQWQGELLNRKKSGEDYWEAVSVSPIINEKGETTHFVAVMEDITLRREYEARLLKQAHYDDLTGLANRLTVRNCLKKWGKVADRNGKKLAVLLIDMDDFKKVNDTLGHAKGDDLLVDVSKRLHDCLSSLSSTGWIAEIGGSETIGRLGGDEFVILIPNLSSEHPVERAAKMLLESLEVPFNISGNEIFLTASIGIAVYPGNNTSVDELLSCADLAMYQAKAEGGDGFQFFTNVLTERAVERLKIENELRQSLTRKEFTLNYQPIVSAKDSRLVGAEVLLRWKNQALGQVSPEQFIPIAESTGLIIPIGEWVLNQALTDLARISDSRPSEFYITVNVSGRQLRDAGFLQSFKDGFARHNLPIRCVKVEVTESMILDEYGETERNLAGLAELGVHLAIDDFGTGFSSLRNLTRVSAEIVKIDKSFVLGMLENVQDANMVCAVIAMAHGLNIRVVAEGVETREHLEFLAGVDCDLIQGWHTGRPTTFTDFIERLKGESEK